MTRKTLATLILTVITLALSAGPAAAGWLEDDIAIAEQTVAGTVAEVDRLGAYGIGSAEWAGREGTEWAEFNATQATEMAEYLTAFTVGQARTHGDGAVDQGEYAKSYGDYALGVAIDQALDVWRNQVTDR